MMHVVFKAAKDRDAGEAERIRRVKAAGKVPRVCGPEVIEAPARGPIRLVVPKVVRVTDGGEVERIPVSHEGRKVAKVCDVFDLMEARTRRKLFSDVQIDVGRRYASLVERHAKGATKCSSLEASGGGSGSGEFMDAFLAEGQEIAAMRQAAAYDRDGREIVAFEVRRGSKVRRIMAGDLVERVCVGQQSLSAVLRSHGWAKTGRDVDALAQALGAALDRMKEVF